MFMIRIPWSSGRMALIPLLLSALLALPLLNASGQTRLPAIQVETLTGGAVHSSSVLEGGLPVVVTFWSTVCKPCLQELHALSDQWPEWQRQVRFKIVAIATDDSRSASKVRALAKSNDWPFTILLDKNQDFKRALNVNAIPHLFIFDPKGNLVYSRIGYNPGSEDVLLKILKGI